MNERQTYEEQLNRRWDDLSLPDENMAWADMKRRLEEEDDDRLVILPVRRGCGIWALLLVLLLVGGFWLIVRPEKWFSDESSADVVNLENNKQQDNDQVSTASSDNNKTTSDQNKITDTTSISGYDSDRSDSKEVASPKSEKVQKQGTERPIETVNDGNMISKKRQQKKINNSNDLNQKEILQPNQRPKSSADQRDHPTQNVTVNNPVINNNGVTPKPDLQRQVTVDSSVLQPGAKGIIVQNDSISAGKPDSSVTKIDPRDSLVIDSPAKKLIDNEQKEKRKIFFAAGVGIHQQIPIAGQQSVTYSSLGRQGKLSDYIPSVYFLMEKERRWFLETGFRYGAPQHNRSTTFDADVKIDSFPNQTFITTNTKDLKKTFYHQLPLSFNYYIARGWSLGTGVVWNKFHSAIVENKTTRRTTQTPDTLIGKTTYKLDNDSLDEYGIKRSWMQMYVQSQYQWRRFTFGARYSFGLQPYITISLPNAPVQNEKNSSLQIYLKYQLWRSKEK